MVDVSKKEIVQALGATACSECDVFAETAHAFDGYPMCDGPMCDACLDRLQKCLVAANEIRDEQ